jgi:hypothetical protein
MKKQLMTLLAGAVLAVCSIFAITTSALALKVGTTDVGGVDTLIADTLLSNSNPATEIAWINSILTSLNNTVVTSYQTIDFSGNPANFWQQTNVVGTYAMKTPTNPEYFMIKTGKIGSPDYRDFLFDNQNSMAWAVVNLSGLAADITEINQLNIGKFSHILEVNGDSTTVPEPGTMMLLGFGMLGLAIYGKRRANNKD